MKGDKEIDCNWVGRPGRTFSGANIWKETWFMCVEMGNKELFIDSHGSFF